jgi:hypothetical protein
MKKAMAASAIGNTPSTATVMRKIRSLLMGVLGLPVLTVGPNMLGCDGLFTTKHRQRAPDRAS